MFPAGKQFRSKPCLSGARDDSTCASLFSGLGGSVLQDIDLIRYQLSQEILGTPRSSFSNWCRNSELANEILLMSSQASKLLLSFLKSAKESHKACKNTSKACPLSLVIVSLGVVGGLGPLYSNILSLI